MSAREPWRAVRAQLETVPEGTVLHFEKYALPHPRDAGAVLSLGWPKGQLADYRFAAEPDCRGMHVHEFAGIWSVHLDRVHPTCSLVEHARADAPQSLFLAGAVLGGMLGAAMSNKRDATLAGAGLGLLAAALFHSSGRRVT